MMALWEKNSTVFERVEIADRQQKQAALLKTAVIAQSCRSAAQIASVKSLEKALAVGTLKKALGS